jgi:hypothetical protein
MPLATADVEERALGVNVADFQAEPFAQAQAAGINRDQGGAMIGAGTAPRMRLVSEAERTTGSLNYGWARTRLSSAGQTRLRAFSQKSLKAQMTWVEVWRAAVS